MVSELDRVNQVFRDAYARTRETKERQSVVFVLLGDELVVFDGEERRVHEVRPPAFHAIKAVSHAPIALHALSLARHDDASATSEESLRHLRERLGSAQAALPDALGGPALASALADCEQTLARTTAALDAFARLVIEAPPPPGTHAHDAADRSLASFARDVGPLLLRLTEHATKIHLQALHDRVESELGTMSAHERGALRVVVTGDHQARERSLGKQYFEKRLPPARPGEERVIYGEGVKDENEALALVGIQRLDRAVAKAFFGDERRLQRDVLGDAAMKLLERSDLAAIA